MSLPAASRLFRNVLRSHTVPVAQVSHKPAKHQIAPLEHAIAMTVFFVSILGPSSWILSHLEDYKKKQ